MGRPTLEVGLLLRIEHGCNAKSGWNMIEGHCDLTG